MRKHNDFVVQCRLKRHVITDEGDFIPANTPVRILCWNEHRKNAVECQSAAYMYVGERLANWSDFTGNVGKGFYFDTEPDNLVYDISWEIPKP